MDSPSPCHEYLSVGVHHLLKGDKAGRLGNMHAKNMILLII
jgi:hypothetical protein